MEARRSSLPDHQDSVPKLSTQEIFPQITHRLTRAELEFNSLMSDFRQAEQHAVEAQKRCNSILDQIEELAKPGHWEALDDEGQD